MVNKKDGFDDDDLNLNDTGSARKSRRLNPPKVEVFDVLSSKTVPDFSGESVIKIPKAIFDSLSPDGSRWHALQLWLINRDVDLLISHALKVVENAIQEGFYLEPDHTFSYSGDQLKTLRGYLQSLSSLYETVFSDVLAIYQDNVEIRVKKELLQSKPFTTLSSQHEVDKKRISELESDVFEKTKLIGSLKNQVDQLSKSLSSAFASKDALVKASDELITAQKKQLDSLMAHLPVRLLKRYYDRH